MFLVKRTCRLMGKYSSQSTAHFGLTNWLLPSLYEMNECEKEEKSKDI